MDDRKENLELVKQLFVNNGEYDFKDEKKAEEFARRLFSDLEDEYSNEGFHHKYDELSDFIHSHHADSTAFFLYQDKYQEEEQEA